MIAPPGRPPGVVQRLVIDQQTGNFTIFFRTRDTTGLLKGEYEWGWGGCEEAYIFPSLFSPAVRGEHDYESSAEIHAKSLREAGEGHIHAVAAGANFHADVVEARRQSTRTSPEEAYALTARLLGERDE